MISSELAKELREYLEWEPKEGDFYTDYGLVSMWSCDKEDLEWVRENIKSLIWLPRLDQLLVEIEKREYFPELVKTAGIGYVLKYYHFKENNEIIPCQFISAKSWEDVAAKALLWVLKNEK